MSDGAPYIVYVGDQKPSENDEVPEVADETETFGETEYLESSNEEDNDEYTVVQNDVEMLEYDNNIRQIKQENSANEDDPIVMTVIQESEQPVQNSSFKWTHAAAVQLILEYQSLEPHLSTGMTVKNFWEEVAMNLQKHDYDVSPVQCKNKFNVMKQIHEKIKEENRDATKKWTYMDLMDEAVANQGKRRSSDDENANAAKPSTPGFKWQHSAILHLIEQYRKYQGALINGSLSQKIVMKLISQSMHKSGFKVTPMQCMIKMHGMKKTYRSITEYNSIPRAIPRSWIYYDSMDSIVRGPNEEHGPDALEEVSEEIAEIEAEESPAGPVFKWPRSAIELLVKEYRLYKPALIEGKMTMYKVYQLISQKLKKRGFHVNASQCQSKINGMMKLYKKRQSGNCKLGRSWTVKEGWYYKLVESIVDKPKRQIIESERDSNRLHLPVKREREEIPPKAKSKKASNILEHLTILEENRERRHRENLEQRQQLINIMRELVEKLE